MARHQQHITNPEMEGLRGHLQTLQRTRSALVFRTPSKVYFIGSNLRQRIAKKW
jgi:hypothetical protein